MFFPLQGDGYDSADESSGLHGQARASGRPQPGSFGGGYGGNGAIGDEVCFQCFSSGLITTLLCNF